MIKEIMKNSIYLLIVIILLILWVEVYQSFQLEEIKTALIAEWPILQYNK